MSNLQFQDLKRLLSAYKFRPSLVGVLITMCLIPLFIKLGNWQYSKAIQRAALQVEYEQSQHASPVDLRLTEDNWANWKYRAVKVSGEYVEQYQFLLDNQVDNERVGYHVITPLKINDSNKVVLVDRGWIAALNDHKDIPQITVPNEAQNIQGWIWIPSTKFYSLESPELNKAEDWQVVWQNMDMKRYQKSVPFEVLPVVIRLDPSVSGGFVRNWLPPDDKSGMNMSYAFQWFGFAIAAFAIFLFVSFKKA